MSGITAVGAKSNVVHFAFQASGVLPQKKESQTVDVSTLAPNCLLKKFFIQGIRVMNITLSNVTLMHRECFTKELLRFTDKYERI